jgi:hypothetical protein
MAEKLSCFFLLRELEKTDINFSLNVWKNSLVSYLHLGFSLEGRSLPLSASPLCAEFF